MECLLKIGPRRTDAAIAALFFVFASIWGGVIWAGSVRAGHRAYFYQSYFEPAVMLACGKGFVIAESQPPPLRAFLLEQTDRFSCADLPPGLTLGTKGLYQRSWRYLMTMVAVAWMLLGISWSGLAPLFGVLFGTTTALAYANFRLLAGRAAGGYPAIQFSVRHYFHLEFITWAILAFLVERGVRLGLAFAREKRGVARPELPAVAASGGVRRVVLSAVLVPSLLLAPLGLLRAYQSGRVTRLLESYVNSPAAPLVLLRSAPGQFRLPADHQRGWFRPGTLPVGPGNPDTRFVQVVVDAAVCRPGTTLTFRYDSAHPDADFSYTVPLQTVESAGPTRVFEAVYTGFEGLVISDSAPGCLQGVFVLTHLERFPLLLSAQLTPGWDGEPQYQRISVVGGPR